MTSQTSTGDAASRRTSRDLKLKAGFGAAVACMLATAGISYDRVGRLIGAVHSVTHTHEVLHRLEDVEDAADDAQSNARGYVITGNERFRRSSEASLSEIVVRLADVRLIVSDNADQLKRLDEVDRLAAARVALTRKTLSLRRSEGFQAASALVASQAPESASSALETAIEGMSAEERRLLAERSIRADADSNILILAASAARCVGAIVVILAFFLLKRHLAERERAESTLTEARDAATSDAEERRKTQEENRRVSERLRAVLDQLDTGVILVEAGGSITLFNRAAERILGAWRDQIEGAIRQDAPQFLETDGKTPLPPERAPLRRALNGETVREVRLFLRAPSADGGRIIVAGAAPLRTPEGLVTGAVMIFRNAE